MRINNGVVERTELNAVGFFSWYGYDLPFRERLIHIKRAGFQKIAIWLGRNERYIIEKRPMQMCKDAKEFDLEIECAHADANYNDIWNPNQELQKNIIEELSVSIEFCATNDIPILVMHVDEGKKSPTPNENGLRVLSNLVDIAEIHKVTLAIENKKETEAIHYLLSAIEKPNLGFCYDSSHDFTFSESPGQILKKWGHRLKYTHFSDISDNLDKHMIPGRGIIDWNIIQTNFPQGWNRNISLEVVQHNPNNEKIDDFLREALEKGKWLQDLLNRKKEI
jgi:sugar phosphate isomerase/epimerase